MDSDLSDYDEDVILPNSPLNQYLNDYEPFINTIFNEDNSLLCKNDDDDDDDQPENHTKIYSKLFSCIYTVLDAAKLYLSYIYSIFVPSLIPFEHSDLKHILNSARLSKVLVSEDLSILSNYESDDEFIGELKLSYATVFQQCFQLFGFIMIYMLLKSAKAVNFITDEYFLQHFPDKFYFLYVLLATCLWLVPKVLFLNIFVIITFICINVSELILCKILCYSIKKRLQTAESIIFILKKCMRFIQEAELIARGFTSASIPGIAERLELSAGLPISSPQRQYPELRKCVFMWTKEIFMFYRRATQKLNEDKIFNPALDFSSQSLAMLNLKEFGDLLSYNIDSDADLQELLKFSDNFSISSLKTMYLLAELQISEYYKYLYLITTFLVSDEDVFHCIKRISHFQTLHLSLKWLQSKQLYVYKQACETYKYYRSVDYSDIENKLVTPKKSSLSSLEINVHNMSLHLKAALKRLTDLEELFESKTNSDESKDKNLLKKVESICKEIKSEIDAYNEYYQKCNSKLQNILYGVKESPTKSLLQEDVTERHESFSRRFIPRCDDEPLIEDEIFEAVVTKSSLLNDDDNCEKYLVEKPNNSEAVGKLMNELKNVLIIKADEHRLREENALAKKLLKGELQLNMCSSKYELIDKVESINDAGSGAINDNDLDDFSSLLDNEISEDSPESDNEEESINSSEQFKNVSSTNHSFAASIAALALQRKKMLDITEDVCFSDSDNEELA